MTASAPLVLHWFLPTSGDSRSLVGAGQGSPGTTASGAVADGVLGSDTAGFRPPTIDYLADVASVVSGPRPVVLTYHAGSLLKGGGVVDVVLGAYERHVLPRVLARAEALVAVSPVSVAS